MALATSKRKFYKLLDNLSTSKINLPASDNNNNNDKQNTSADRPGKRSRMVASPARPSSPPRSSSKTTTVRILSSNFESSRAGKNSPSRSDSSKSASTYAPWSHDQFLLRLKTFADVKLWSVKPDRINEVAWAKRGWVVVAHDEITCRICGEHVLIKLERQEQFNEGTTEDRKDDDDWWSADIEEKLVEKYESLIMEGHERNCLWRKGGCKDDIYRIPFSDQGIRQKDLYTRYSALLTVSESLPSTVTIPKVTEGPDRELFDVDRITDWFSIIWKSNEAGTYNLEDADAQPATEVTNTPQADINKVALVMAICGWTGQDVAGVPIAACEKCFARIGLWMYKASTLTDDDHKLDPVGLHRAHCPWQNPTSQSGLGRFAGLPGWEILHEMVCSNITRARRQKRLSSAVDDDLSDTESPRPSSKDIDEEDKARESKLARLRRALTSRRSKKSFDQSSR